MITKGKVIHTMFLTNYFVQILMLPTGWISNNNKNVLFRQNM